MLPHVWNVGSQACPLGQSVDVAQPHLPPTHWFMPVHAPHWAPLVPQEPLLVPDWHSPFASQHPLGHVPMSHLETHEPFTHVWAVEQAKHEPPEAPHAVLEGV